MENIGWIIFGNACSLLAMGTDSLSSSRKTTKGMLWMQNASQFIYAVGGVALKGYSGVVQNVVCIARNLTVIKGWTNKWLQWLLVILAVALGFAFNNLGLIGVLPIVANLQYTLLLFKFPNNERLLKISFMITCLLFAIFSLAIWNFVGVCTNLVVVISAIVFLLKSKKKD